MAAKKIVKKSASVKKAVRRSPSARRRSSETDKYWDDNDIVKGDEYYGDGMVGTDFRPKRAGGAGGRLMKSPRALRMQAEAKWAERGGRFENSYGVQTPYTKPQYGRTNPNLGPFVNRNKNGTPFGGGPQGPTGKLASKKKTNGKSGPTKKR